MRINSLSIIRVLPAVAAMAAAPGGSVAIGQDVPAKPAATLEVVSGTPEAPPPPVASAQNPAMPSGQSSPWQNVPASRFRNPFLWDGGPEARNGLFGRVSPQHPAPAATGAATAPGTAAGGAPPAPGAPAPAPAPAPGTSPAEALSAAGAAAGPGFGGGLAATQEVFPMIGDQGPFSALQVTRFPPIPRPLPPGQPGPDPRALAGASVNRIVPAIRGSKIADNQSPRPIDRVFVSFNYYDDVNADLNRRFNAPISREHVYHEVFGFEKTFFDQNASIGLRVPLNTLGMDSRFPGLGGTHTGAGNLDIFGKFILLQDRESGSLVSAGLSVIAPTGPSAFASFPTLRSRNTTEIQPFVGYLLNSEKWFLQGFFSVDVPTNSALATMLYVDSGLGYYLYRDNSPGKLLSAVVPTFKAHLNTPLSDRGYSVTNVAGTPDVLDLTFGSTFVFRRKTLLTVAYVTPVTGPRPFGGELAVFFNYRFGGPRSAAVASPPPLAGQ